MQVALGLVLALAACGAGGGIKSPSRPVSLGREFALTPARAALVGEERLRVEFERVSADSRCPIDVHCITAGDATVKVALHHPSLPRAAEELHTMESRRQVFYAGHRIRLVRLEPQPRSTSPIAPKDYVATFVVTKE